MKAFLSCFFKTVEVFFYLTAGAAMAQHNMKSCIICWIGGTLCAIVHYMLIKDVV